MKVHFFLLLSLGLLFAVAQVPADLTLRADKTKSYLTYSAKHPLHAWSGTTRKVDCLLVYDGTTKSFRKVAVSAQVADFDSENANRDSHALEVLEAIRFPKVTFSSTSIAQDGDKLVISGKLNFHGKPQDITFTGEAKVTAKGIEVQGTFPVSMKKFDVEPPSFMLMATEDTLKISFAVYFEIP